MCYINKFILFNDYCHDQLWCGHVVKTTLDTLLSQATVNKPTHTEFDKTRQVHSLSMHVHQKHHILVSLIEHGVTKGLVHCMHTVNDHQCM